MKKHKITLLFFSFFSLLLLDQISKYLVRSKSGLYICNPGISFGLEFSKFFLYPIWLIIFFSLVYILFKKYPRYSYAIILVLSGSFSNLIDRIKFGCVIDFIDLKIRPVFNFADIFISLGIITLLIQSNSKKGK